MTLALSSRDTRRLFLASQGLLRHNEFGKGKNAVLKAIQQLSYVQIDTISVIERAHNHVLWSRVDNFTQPILDQLQSKHKSVFEYWAHAAAYLPMKDYRFYQPTMQSMAERYPAEKKVKDLVLTRIREEGPLQARDFEDNRHKSTGWWDWKPAKQAMERLFLAGELMIAKREGFQKVYDLKERVLPEDIDTRMPSEKEWQRFQINTMINALGLARIQEICYLRTTTRKLFKHDILPGIKRTIAELNEAGEIIEVSLHGNPYFTTEENLNRIPIRLGRKNARFLSPFDNLVIQRKRTLELFDFDYQLECYLPAHKRTYGYFSLPILWGDELIGRMDAKADRKKREFQIRFLCLNENFRSYDELAQPLSAELIRFAQYNGCDCLNLQRVDPAALKSLLKIS
ncbi:MAG: crosslink repair DNA glycosylase YcaQ family protein [Gammaproteobacteria bacterium]|nr:crosslink repair DNA glycosylase YcaQ family protein [Gammaproteobacteria bacterium]